MRTGDSLDFKRKSCKFNAGFQLNGKYPYNDVCKHFMVICKDTCRKTGKFYIGCTGKKVKCKMIQLYNRRINLDKKGLNYYAFENHNIKQQEVIEGKINNNKDSLFMSWQPIFLLQIFQQIKLQIVY